ERRRKPRRVEPEFAESHRRPFGPLHHPDWSGHVHEFDRVIEVLGKRRWRRFTSGGPPPVGPAHERPASSPGFHLDAIHVLPLLWHPPRRHEFHELLALSELTGDHHGREQPYREQSGSGSQHAAARAAYRRLHHTTVPTATTLSGSSTTISRKMRC